MDSAEFRNTGRLVLPPIERITNAATGYKTVQSLDDVNKMGLGRANLSDYALYKTVIEDGMVCADEELADAIRTASYPDLFEGTLHEAYLLAIPAGSSLKPNTEPARNYEITGSIHFVLSDHLGGNLQTGRPKAENFRGRANWYRTFDLRNGKCIALAPDIPMGVQEVEAPFEGLTNMHVSLNLVYGR